MDSRGSALRRKTHQTIQKVTGDIEKDFHFNTAISAVMELVNEIYSAIGEKKEIDTSIREATKIAVLLLSPFVPHIAEELWQNLGERSSIFKTPWPSFDENAIKEKEVTVIIQVNGRVRSKISVPVNSPEDKLKEIVLVDAKVTKWIQSKEIKKFIVIPDKLVNIVV